MSPNPKPHACARLASHLAATYAAPDTQAAIALFRQLVSHLRCAAYNKSAWGNSGLESMNPNPKPHACARLASHLAATYAAPDTQAAIALFRQLVSHLRCAAYNKSAWGNSGLESMNPNPKPQACARLASHLAATYAAPDTQAAITLFRQLVSISTQSLALRTCSM